jgi:hypothetical protein
MLQLQWSTNLKAMSFRRQATVGVALLLTLVGFFSLSRPDSFAPLKNPFVKSEPINSISGRDGGDGPVLVVKLDDTRPAHPQIGIEDADIVYIEQVEGGLTRLAAVFSSKIPQRIGPVRSARISDIELLAQFGRVGFAYSGAQSKLRPVLDSANLVNASAERNSATIYTTDPARVQPYAMVLRADLLLDSLKAKGLELEKSRSIGWKFGDAPKGGKVVQDIHLSWPASTYDAHWSKEENRWLLDHSGIPNFADSGYQLGASTLVIQKVEITDSIYKDKVGGVTPFSATVGTGQGYIARDGKVFAATWNRPTEESGTEWKTLDGEEISFNKGQIWVALTDKEPVFKAPLADASKSSSK